LPAARISVYGAGMKFDLLYELQTPKRDERGEYRCYQEALGRISSPTSSASTRCGSSSTTS
jgi:hypothetical protein